MSTPAIDLDGLRREIGAVPDPEVPVLTIADLGVLRSVAIEDGRVVVTITPTYSGCPAMAHIAERVASVLDVNGVDGDVRTVLSPAWSTDWMTDDGRRKLAAYGIAPPHVAQAADVLVAIRPPVACPRCASSDTRLVSEFGSTACKAHYVCRACDEPFDYFKEL